MKKLFICLLLGVTLVGCGNKREVKYIEISEWCADEFFFVERGYDKDDTLKLIQKDLESADLIYEGYKSLIKTENYIILYTLIEADGEHYKIFINFMDYGDKEFIENIYNNVYKKLYGDLINK